MSEIQNKLSDFKKKSNIIVNEFANKSLPTKLNRTTSGLEKYSGSWGAKQIAHLLRRTTFGAKKENLQTLKNKTLDEAIDLLLQPQNKPLPPVNYYQATYADPNGIALGETWINSAYGDGTVNFYRRNGLRYWWIGLILNQPISISEKMTLFWHNLLATETNEYDDARYAYLYSLLLRSFAIGNYKTLIKEITLNPAMLKYLNGYLNTKTAPDENYARELQELFTLGKGPDSNYTEDDVKQAAKILTGWKINTSNPPSSYFDLTRHDTSNKIFSSFYNFKVIQGRNNSSAGTDELNDLINMIFSQDEVAKYICRRLYRWFIYYVIDNNAEQNIIIPLAQIFRNNNYEIKPVLETLLKSAHFFDPLNMGCMIKSPIDMTIGLSREYDILFPNSTDLVKQYRGWQHLTEISNAMAQNIGDPPNIAGWPAYYQEPQFYEIWINSDTLPKRNAFSDAVISKNGYNRNSVKLIIEPILLVDKFANPSDPNLLISEALETIYAIDVTQTQIAFMKSILLSNQSSDHYWTDAWNLYKANPTNATYKEQVNSRLQSFFKQMMNLAEYQLS